MKKDQSLQTSKHSFNFTLNPVIDPPKQNQGQKLSSLNSSQKSVKIHPTKINNQIKLQKIDYQRYPNISMNNTRALHYPNHHPKKKMLTQSSDSKLFAKSEQTFFQNAKLDSLNTNPTLNNLNSQSSPKNLIFFQQNTQNSAQKNQKTLSTIEDNHYFHRSIDKNNFKNVFQKFSNKQKIYKHKRGNLMQQIEELDKPLFSKIDHIQNVLNVLDGEIQQKIQQNPQILELADKIQDIFNYFTTTIQNFSEYHFSQLSEIAKLNEIITEDRQNLLELQEVKDDLAKKLNQKQNLLNNYMINLDPNNKQNINQQNFLGLENIKLGQQLEQVSNRIEKLESGKDLADIKQELQEIQQQSKIQIQDLKIEIDRYNREISKQKASFTTLQTLYKRMSTELENLQTTNTKLEEDYDRVVKENKINHTGRLQWREKALMQYEDMQGYLERASKDKVLINRLQVRCEELKSRLDKFHLQRSKEVEIPVNETQFQEDKSFFQKQEKELKDQNLHKFKLIEAVEAKQSQLIDPIRQKILEKWKESVDLTIREQSEIKLEKIQVFFPNYYVFIEQGLKHHELEVNNLSTRKISLSYIATMRYILDSKYTEILHCENNYNLISKFPDFVYSWLCTYSVDDRTKKIRFMTPNERLQSDTLNVFFLLDLLNPKLQTHWEYITFKEFLGEYSTKDELFFYLHCRALLFKGQTLTHNNTPFEVIKYVKIEDADRLIDVILRKYEPISIVHLKTELRERLKKKTFTLESGEEKTLLLIDSGFILRILLQYYRAEKQHNYKHLSEAFTAVQTIDRHGKFCVNFPHFKKIIEMVYTNISSLETAQLYREAYSIGNGAVTVDTFYSVACNSGFLTKYLKLPSSLVQYAVVQEIKVSTDNLHSTDRLPDDYSQRETYTCELTNDDCNQEYNMFLTTYKRMEHIIEPLLEMGKQMGVESLSQEIQETQTLIKSQFKQPDIDQVMKGVPLIIWVQRFMNLIQKIKNIVYFYSALNNQHIDHFSLDLDQVITNDFLSMETVLRTQEEYFQYIKIQEDYKSKKATQLQKAFQSKITKFYSFISSLLSANLKNRIYLDKKTKQAKDKETAQPSKDKKPENQGSNKATLSKKNTTKK